MKVCLIKDWQKDTKTISPNATALILSSSLQEIEGIKDFPNFKKVFLPDEFQKLQKEIELPFIEACVEETKSRSNLKLWWTTPFPSRSSTETSLFKKIIYSHVFLNKGKNEKIDYVFVDDLYLANQIKLLTKEKKTEVIASLKSKFFYFCERNILPTIKLLLLFFYFTYRKVCLIKNRQDFNTPSAFNLFLSWHTQGTLEDSHYSDRNFGPLINQASTKESQPLTLPLFFNLSNWRLEINKIIRYNKENHHQFIIPESHISFSQFFTFLKDLYKLKSVVFKDFQVNQSDFSQLCNDTFKKHLFSIDRCIYNASFLALETLKNKHVCIEKIIYPFENNSIEKFFLQCCYTNYPQASVYGFQHSLWYKGQPSMRIITEEHTTHPLPKKIALSGAAYEKVLNTCGFQSIEKEVWPSYRFLQLKHYEPLTNKNEDIAVISNFSTQESLLTLKFAVELTSKSSSKRPLSLKTHPLNDIEQFKDYIKSLSSNMKIRLSKKSVKETLENSNICFIPGASIAAFESALLGVPTFVCINPYSIFLNPFWDNFEPLIYLKMITEKEPFDFSNLKLTENEKKDVINKIQNNYFEKPAVECPF